MGPLYQVPTGNSGAVALSASTPTAIGGVNQQRRSITIISADNSQTIWLYWGTSARPTAATIKAQGQPLAAGFPATYNYTLGSDGNGGTSPVLWGIAGTSDQVSPADTRWSEGS